MSWSVPHVTRGDLKRLANATNRIRGFHGRGAQERINAAIRDQAGDEVSAAIRNLAEQGMLGMDSVSVALLAHHGANPGAVAALRCALYRFRVQRGFVTLCNVDTPMTVRIGTSDAWWHPDRSVITGLQRVPDTLTGQLQGSPLATLLRHEALDPLGLVIEEVETTDSTSVKVAGATHVSRGLGEYGRPPAERGKPGAASTG